MACAIVNSDFEQLPANRVAGIPGLESQRPGRRQLEYFKSELRSKIAHGQNHVEEPAGLQRLQLAIKYELIFRQYKEEQVPVHFQILTCTEVSGNNALYYQNELTELPSE